MRKHLIPPRTLPNRSERIELGAPGLRPRKALYWSLLISVVLHTVIIFYQVELPEREKPIRKPISVKFVQRAPRLSKALELMKRPVVVQRQLTRKITRPKSVIPRTIRTSAVHGGTALASLAKPGEAVERSLYCGVWCVHAPRSHFNPRGQNHFNCGNHAWIFLGVGQRSESVGGEY